jgi:membrane dipeptidase
MRHLEPPMNLTSKLAAPSRCAITLVSPVRRFARLGLCLLAGPLAQAAPQGRFVVQGEGRLAVVEDSGADAVHVAWQVECNLVEGVALAPNGNLFLTLPGGHLAEVASATRRFVWRADVDGERERLPALAPLARASDDELARRREAFAEFGEDVRVWELAESGPEADLFARARAIHWSTLTLDTHKDIRDSLAAESAGGDGAAVRDDPRRWGPNQVDFPKMRAGGLDCAFYIVYVGQGPLDAEGYARAKTQALAKFDAIERQARRFPDEIVLARTPDDVLRGVAEGKLVSCIGIENGYAMGEDLALIAEFQRRGARYMSITHNGHSQLGDSNTPAEPLHGGLTELGRRAIEELNRLGIMVDVSHSGKTTMMQALAHSKAPVLASHSGVRALCDHPRNLDDEQLRALAAKRGVLQCVAFDSYVVDATARDEAIAAARAELGLPPRQRFNRVDPATEDQAKLTELRKRVAEIEAQHPRATVADLVDHIDHAVKLMGIDFVAISSDFDGGGGILGWRDASETFNVTLELVRRGYDTDAIQKLWSGNTLRLWREVAALVAD